MRGSYLPVRLKRETPFKSQVGCTAALSVLLLAMGALGWFAAKSEGKGSNWVGYVVGAAFGFFGLLLLWSFIRQLAASGMKETIVEMAREPLQPGEKEDICVIQPGPAKLKSLRANLVCMEERTRKVWNSEKKMHVDQREERLVSSENVLEATHLNVAAGDEWHEMREFRLPADAKVSETDAEGVRTFWKIEVWGTGYALASFMHPFPVDVYRGQRPDLDDYPGDEGVNDDVDGDGE
ncbi:hypothetical protein AYO49_03945 [Verrucomicrobiaceae bacterium SCGC AG-212-N21]|nr:hypothetical protein AYO49_03945 [Verrucomicrobiaceae bacterium SCGC AG-212-N21]